MTVDSRIHPWARKDRRVYVFKNANVVNADDGTVSVGTNVMISEGKIKAVTSTNINEPDVIEIDAEGMFLCPGLIDCHVHLSFTPGTSTVTSLFSCDSRESFFRQPYVCSQMLRKGFTSVRDTAGATFALKEAIAEGVFPGPRLFISGKALSQTGGHGDFRARHEHDNCCAGRISSQCLQLCDGVPECLKAARQELRIGADFIKIMAGGGVASPFDAISDLQFTAEEIKAITTVAGNRNTYVTAHAYTPSAIKMAIENGVTCIEHGNKIDEETAKLMAQNDVFLVPTLVTYSEMAETSWSDFLPSGISEKNAEVLQDGLKSLLVAQKSGVVICFGTDLLGPLVAAQTKEFALRAQVLSAAEILKSATVSAAKLLRHEGLLGQIKPGYFADLIVLNTNPLEDISVFDRPMEHLMAVIKDGRVEVSQWDRLPTDV